MAVTTVPQLPTLYEYYTSDNITTGLSADKSYFTLNNKNITLYSGAMHYFRTPKKLWRDRLRKLRAAGLNAVETYVPWNLHEPTPGTFDFGQGGSDMEDFLDISGFLQIAKEEDLLAIVRPGPYICAEWEFGGFPSWLLRERNLKIRTSETTYMTYVKRFFNALLPILAALQFINGGPIIMFQVENEYGSTYSPNFTPDKKYLEELRQIFLDNNITSLLFTSDGVTSFGSKGSLPEYFLMTANFAGSPNASFQALEQLQPGKPKMAMEFYPGWFDHWGEVHNTRSILNFIINLEMIIQYPGSFNLYMMHGGTNFGLLNGANLNNNLADNSGFQPDTTSYDYNAPLSEDGDYTFKYDILADLLNKYATPKTRIPEKPSLVSRVAYSKVSILEHIPLKSLIDQQDAKFEYLNPVSMETLPINNNSGQSFGYIVYRKDEVILEDLSILTIEGHICDSLLVLVNGKQILPSLLNTTALSGIGFWHAMNTNLTLTSTRLENATLDLIVENWGRVGYGKISQFNQYKGLWQGDLLINGEIVKNWTHIPLEFKKSWIAKLEGWRKYAGSNEPGIYKGYLIIEDDNPKDTYIDLRNWTKGIAMVNGFVLGRYARIGPQQCLYLPGVFLKKGQNEIMIFEHYVASSEIIFNTDQIYETLQ